MDKSIGSNEGRENGIKRDGWMDGKRRKENIMD